MRLKALVILALIFSISIFFPIWISLYPSVGFRYCINHEGEWPTEQHSTDEPAAVFSISGERILFRCMGTYARKNAEPITAIGTILLFFVTVLMAYIAWKQADTTQRQLRAYLGIDEDKRPWVEQRIQRGKALFHVFAKNFGVTPARNFNWHVLIDIFDCEQEDVVPVTLDFPDWRKANKGTMSLKPGEEFYIRLGDKLPKISKKTLEEIYKVNNPKKRLIVYGYVVYEDAFGAARYSNICCRLIWHRGRENRPSWFSYREYNDSN